MDISKHHKIPVRVDWDLKTISVTGKQFHSFVVDPDNDCTWSVIIEMKDETFGDAVLLNPTKVTPKNIFQIGLELRVGPPFYESVDGIFTVID